MATMNISVPDPIKDWVASFPRAPWERHWDALRHETQRVSYWVPTQRVTAIKLRKEVKNER